MWTVEDIAPVPKGCKHNFIGPNVRRTTDLLEFTWVCAFCDVDFIVTESCPMTPEAVIPRASLNLELEDAVRILNEKKHRNITDWIVAHNCCVEGLPDTIACSRWNPPMNWMMEFEALACAERYLREKSDG